MRDVLLVEYKWNDGDEYGDLVCDVTKFMDNYILHKTSHSYHYTYLYNDLLHLSTKNLLQIAFRYPGATRGSIILKRLDTNKFEIVGYHYNMDVCFDEFGVYDRQMIDDMDIYVGSILDFSNVKLMNNYVESTYDI